MDSGILCVMALFVISVFTLIIFIPRYRQPDSPKKSWPPPPPHTHFPLVDSLEEIPQHWYMMGHIVGVRTDSGVKVYACDGKTFSEVKHTVCPTCGR